jgi:glycosyltransferase involved in cell wall biosynthesis
LKIFCHVPRENWIVDRMGNEFLQYSSHDVSLNKIEEDTELIWLFASWCWNQIPMEILARKKVVCTIHHEVPEKFDEKRKKNFLLRDKFVDYYHTYTRETETLIKSLSQKPIKIIPHWVNNKIWIKEDKNMCREVLNLPKDKFLIGSFQRDTEGSDLKTPKLEKGPDILVEKIKDICEFKQNVHVVLSGWRRQYVINRLNEEGISFTYIELPDQQKINKLYNSLDLYIVSSRCEGGPQSLFEASCLKTPIISTKVGQSFFLNKNCIYSQNDKITQKLIDLSLSSTEYNFNNIKHLLIDRHVKQYDKHLEEIRWKNY